LRSELDLPYPAATASFRLGFQFHSLFGLVTLVALGAFVESDGGFQYQEDIVAGPFDLPNRGGYTVRIGKRLIDRVSQFLHEISQAIVQFIPRFYRANPPLRVQCHLQHTTRFSGGRTVASYPNIGSWGMVC